MFKKRRLLLSILIGIINYKACYAINILHTEVRMNIPSNIKYVGEAIQYLLEPYAYTLLTEAPAPLESYKISSQELPIILDINSSYPLQEAILHLIGEQYNLIIDHRHKLISFSNNY